MLIKLDKRLLLQTTVLAGAAALTLAVPAAALAQSQPDSPPTPAQTEGEPGAIPTEPDAPEEAAAASANEVAGVVVTGSRIRRNEFTSASPITVITTDEAALEGLVDPTEILQSSTAAAGSTQINNQFTGFVIEGGGGVNTISLRGLGAQRTLVLMNGRRLPPAGTQGQVGAVDLNILPNTVIQRYEILKNGASSIYGSDAIAGVINVITRTNLDELVIEGGINIPERGGFETASFGLAWGKVLGRGRFQVAAEYYKQEALKFGDRPYSEFMCGERYTFDPATGQRNDWYDVDQMVFKCIGPTGSTGGYIPVFLSNGAFYGSRLFISEEGPGYPGNPPFYGASNPDPNLPGMRFAQLGEREFVFPIEENVDLFSPVERLTLFADGAYDLGFGEVYGEALIHNRKSSQYALQQYFPNIPAQAPCPVNRFNCPGVTAPGIPFGTFTPQLLIYNPYIFDQDVTVVRGLAGLRGDFLPNALGGWEYDAYVSYSHNNGEYTQTGGNAELFLASIGGDFLPFTGICPVGAPPQCRPLHLLDPEYVASAVFSPEDYEYIKLSDTGETRYTQVIAEASISGDLFRLPAGPVGTALGVSIRHDKLDDQPGAEMVAQNFYNLATAGPTKGDDTLKEVYGEIEVPLLRDMPFFEDLTLNASGRYSDYDTVGSADTYKLGLNWAVNNQLRFRATKGTSFRAPALYELFLGDQQGFLGQGSVDPCIRHTPTEGGGVSNENIRKNCLAHGIPGNFGGLGGSALIIFGGGTDLEPETSDSMSIGFVLTPEFADLNIAVDYYEVTVDNQVVSSGAAVVGQCYASADFPNNPFCSLFTRNFTAPPTSSNFRKIEQIDASFRNIISQTNRGIDLELVYRRDIGPGRFQWDASATWTLEDTQELFPGNTDDFKNVIGEPAVVASTEFEYQVRDVTFTWFSDFIGRQSNYEYQFGTDISPPSNFTTPIGSRYRGKNHAEATWFHGFSVGYEGTDWEVAAGMRNIFDERAPKVSPPITPDRGQFTYGRIGSHAFATQYRDAYIGRSLFFNVTKRF